MQIQAQETEAYEPEEGAESSQIDEQSQELLYEIPEFPRSPTPSVASVASSLVGASLPGTLTMAEMLESGNLA